MITSAKRSAVAVGLILAVGGALAGCGDDEEAGAAGDPTATPAWDSTPANPGAAPTEDGETAAADDPADESGADEDQTAADGGAGPAGDASGDAAGGGGPGGGGPGGDASGGPGSGADDGPDDPPAQPFPQPIDACALGAEAIAGILGAGPTPEDQSDPAAFGPACAWTGAGGHEIVVSVADYDDWVGMEDLLGGGAEEVDGLGTEAWAALESPSNVQVAWRRDDISVAVSASLTSGGEAMLDVALAIDAALMAAGY